MPTKRLAAVLAALVAAGCGSSGAPSADEALARLAPVARPGLAASPSVAGSGEQTLDAFVQRVAADVEAVWQESFGGGDLAYTPARLVAVQPGQQAETQCNHTVVADDPVGPFYCPDDDTVYLPLQFVDRELLRPFGDFAVAYAVAHELAHHVQDLIGYLERQRQGTLLTIRVELQADCFAGVWAHSAYGRGLLDRDDVSEAIRAENLLGDADGTPDTDPRAHGISGLRSAWFLTGYRSGRPADCDPYPVRRRGEQSGRGRR